MRFRGSRILPALLLLVALPAAAEKNLAGMWSATYAEDWSDRVIGPGLGDYAGLPINAANRLRAQSWSAALIALPEYQCRVHPADYANSFGDIRIWDKRDPLSEALVALHLQHSGWQMRRTIWMDGRAHPPPHAQHTAMGFSTGVWKGHVLTVKTTHLKEGWLRRNGVARSDQATLTEHFIRHGDILSWTVIVNDPVYLEEPFIRNREYRYSIDSQLASDPCIPIVEMVREPGSIPHHLPGQNPELHLFSEKYRIPFEAAMGGDATMYPEYLQVLKILPVPAPARAQGDP